MKTPASLKQLAADPHNPREMTNKAAAGLSFSLDEFGDISGITFNLQTRELVTGHQRVDRLREKYGDLEIRDGKIVTPSGHEFAIRFVTWSREKQIAANMAANSPAIQGAFTAGINEFADIGIDAFPEMAEALDFASLKIELPEENEEEEVQLDGADDVLELKPNPAVSKGQIWILGNHRLMCGDSTSQEDVKRLLNGEKPLLMVTDPPYGVELDQSWRDEALGDKAMGPGNKNVVANDDRADWSDAWRLFTGNVVYVWHASKYCRVVADNLESAGFEIVQQLIWNKTVMVMGRCDYHFKHEPCWYAVRKGKNHGWAGDRKQTTVIDAAAPNHIMSGSKEYKTKHPTQKPIKCMLDLMKNHRGSVYDPFLGSGTTLIAAEQLKRKCFGMELSPAYCVMIIERWQNITGKQAILEGTGETYEQKAAEARASTGASTAADIKAGSGAGSSD